MVFDLEPGKDYADNARRASLHEEVLRRVEGLPAVRSGHLVQCPVAGRRRTRVRPGQCGPLPTAARLSTKAWKSGGRP